MMIEARNVSKSYGGKHVLSDVSLKVDGPSIIGLLGHNGAGKTTFLNMLAGLIPPTKGELLVNNRPVFNEADILSDVCFIAESGNFQEDMTVMQSLKANSFFYPKWDHILALELLRVFDLTGSEKVRNLSKGMVSALGIISGLASRAAITIFDEPYIGLDVSARSTFYDLLIEQQTEEPRIFILSTHLVNEASGLFEDVIILHEGKVILQKRFDDWEAHVMAVKGRPDDVKKATEGLHVLHEHTFLNELTAVAYLEGSKLDFAGVKTEQVSLQELLVLLSKQRKKEAGA
ncbi:MAG: ABC transporter ATP-binding protein [Bacillus sp. (in: firmicutes)]